MLPQVVVGHLVYDDHLKGGFGGVESPEGVDGRDASAVLHVGAERPYEGIHPLDEVEAVRELVGVGQAAIDPEAVGEGGGGVVVVVVLRGGGGVEEVGVGGGGGVGAEAEREGELELVRLLRLLRPALAAAAVRRPIRCARVVGLGVRIGDGGGDGGGPVRVVAAHAAPAGLALPIRHAEPRAVALRRGLERGGGVVVGRRWRVVRRAGVVADACGRGGGE